MFAILGYDPREEHPGRGVVEAVGTDMDFHDGDLAYRVNFATADWPQIIDRRVGRDLSLRGGAGAGRRGQRNARASRTRRSSCEATVEHRGALVIRDDDGPLSAEVTNTDPAYRKEGSLGVALETFEPGGRTVRAARGHRGGAARRRADERVRGGGREDPRRVGGQRASAGPDGRLPANLILTRDGGDHLPRLQPIRDRFGPAWGCFVEMPVERGIATCSGWTRWTRPPQVECRADGERVRGVGAPGRRGPAAVTTPCTSTSRVRTSRPTTAAPRTKRDVIEAIDRAFFGEVLAD